MINKYTRFFNQNIFNFIVIAIIIAFIIGAIQLINQLFKEKNNSYKPNIEETNTIEDYKSLKSAVGEEETSNEIKAKNKDKQNIKKFMDYCNDNDVESAYSMVSDECKEVIYNNSIETFENNYINPRFSSKKTYNIQSWSNYIFKVSIQKDLLETAEVDNTPIIDYIASTAKDDKLNIGGFIGSQELNKEHKEDNIVIKVTKILKFMDYEKYLITVTNNTGKDIQMDDLKNPNTIYVTDDKGVNHTSTNENLTIEQLKIKNGGNSQFTIKFINPYISDRTIKTLTFSNIKIDDKVTKIESNI